MADAPDRERRTGIIWFAAAALAVIAAATWMFVSRPKQGDHSGKRVEAVIRSIQRGSESDRAAAILGLGLVATEPDEFALAFPHVVRAMKDESQMVRGAAASVVGGTISRYAQKKQFANEQESSLAALCREAEGAIEALLDDPSPTIRADVARSLALTATFRRLDDPPPRLVAHLDDEDASVREAVAKAVTSYRQGPELVVPVALRRLTTEGPPAGQVYRRVLSSMRLKPSSLPLLIEGLSSDNADMRLSCATAINHMGADAEPALPAILALLRRELEAPRAADSDLARVQILAMASGAVGEITTGAEAPPGAVEILCEVLRRPGEAKPGSDPGRPGSPGAPAPQVDYMLAEAAWSLGIFGRSSAPAVPLLLSTFEAAPETPSLFRGHAAEALAEIARGTPDEDRVIASLAKAWKAAPRSQRADLTRALRILGPKSEQVVPELRQEPPDETPSRIRRVRYPRSDREEPVRE